MNKTIKSAIIGILKSIVKLNELASNIPYAVALKTNPYMLIAKVVLGILSVVADWLLISLVAVKTAVPVVLLKYDPLWIRGKLSGDEPERRKLRFNDLRKRNTEEIKLKWMQKYGTQEVVKNYLSGLRKPEKKEPSA